MALTVRSVSFFRITGCSSVARWDSMGTAKRRVSVCNRVLAEVTRLIGGRNRCIGEIGITDALLLSGVTG
jgi:hypothetical protein